MSKYAKSVLLIVESPAKCKKIEEYLGPGYKCVASYGHITTLESLKDVDIDNHFKPKFKMIQSKKHNIDRLEVLIKKYDEVVLATDDDREGEAIAWHICNLFKLSVTNTKRIIFHEVTKSAILKAMQHPVVINMNIVHAQQARQILDIMVGFKLSPLLWSHISRKTKTGLSAGRCQTPALRIIYENQQEIDKSPGKMVYTTTGYFTKHSLPFQLNHQFTDKATMERFLEESVDFIYKYQCGKVRNTTKNPPKPFTTSRIQQTANTELRCSPKETMMLCQKLYEGGFITYMRTDSDIYSKDFIQLTKTYVENKWSTEYVRPDIDTMGEKKTNKKKDDTAQEAHEAIRPTDITRIEIPEEFSPKERKMYKLIWHNTLESCMAPAKYHAITAVIVAPQTMTEVIVAPQTMTEVIVAPQTMTDVIVAPQTTKEYRYSSDQVVFPGWKVVMGYEKENPTYHFLKALKSIDTYKKIVSKVTLKELKQHYTEAKLVQILEEKGIGRPSTFASLIEKIQDRGYVKRDNIKGKTIKCIDFELEGEELSEIEHEREFGNENNKLVIQSVGVLVIEFLLKHFPDFFNYDYTKNMENDLDNIAKDTMVWYKPCEKCLADIESTPCIQERKQIVIDKNHVYMIGKYGPVIKYTVYGDGDGDGDSDTIKFKNVRKDIDITKLERGEYTLQDILLQSDLTSLGYYKDEEVFIKKGKFGHYVQIGGKTISLAKLDKNIMDITLEDVIELMTNSDKDIVRYISDDISLRKSKYGVYIYYRTPTHKKPEFISLKNYKETDIEHCDINIIIEYVNKHKKK